MTTPEWTLQMHHRPADSGRTQPSAQAVAGKGYENTTGVRHLLPEHGLSVVLLAQGASIATRAASWKKAGILLFAGMTWKKTTTVMRNMQ
jgi:hypothetical protein